MNTKALCMIVILFTFLIFLGNRSAARNECVTQDNNCVRCDCEIQVTVKNPDSKKEPSCSVVFQGNIQRVRSANLGSADPLSFLGVKEIKTPPQPFTMCDVVIYCDPGASADLTCTGRERYDPGFLRTRRLRDTKIKREIWSQNRCPVYCVDRGEQTKEISVKCDHWERPKALPPAPVKKPPVTKPPVKKPPAKRPGLGMFASMFADPSEQNTSAGSSYVADTYSEPSAAGQDPDEKEVESIINDSARWRSPNGEAGVEQGVLMVAKGEADAQSFCTGNTITVAAPNLVTLPTCPSDASGLWEGAFARPVPKGAPPGTPRVVVPISLELRKDNGSVRGELKTSDGTFNISGNQNGENIGLEAVRTGTQAKISLNGKATKDSITFGASEQSSEGVMTYRLVGFARRLYIADRALPVALLNAPYNFRLTAYAPSGQALAFRLTTPPVKYPEINWFTPAEATRGRNGERFTYLCPPNGSLGGTLYGTDTYSDSSTICKAAVHAGVITQRAGGVVTIQVKPDPGSYTASTRNGIASSKYSFGSGKGSFVFVANDAGERGRLPKGISFDTSTGTLRGTPSEAGSFDLSIVADDGNGNLSEQPLTLTVKKLAVTNALLHDGFAGQPYAATLDVAGGQPPYRFSGKMPTGLQLDPATGAISGTPSSPISFAKVEVTIRDSQNNVESQTITLSVRGATILGSHFLPDARVGVPYRMQFQTAGLPSVRLWTLYGTDAKLIGLHLNEQTGELSGTPTRAGTFFLNVRAETGASVPTRGFALTIN
jgi:hypothetical protein